MAACNWWSLNLLAFVADKNKTYEYSSLIKKTIGKKFALLYNIVILLATFLTIIAFITTSKFKILLLIKISYISI